MTRSIMVKPSGGGFDQNIWRTLADVSSALLADTHPEVVCLGSPMRSFGGRPAFSGPAVTISSGSMAQWKALEMAMPGQVLIITTGSRHDRAEFGAIFVELAKRKGVAAIITDGFLRDSEEIGRIDVAVFGCGTHPSSPRDDTQGRIGMPELLHGAGIETGDVVVGDADGLAIIPSAVVPAVLESLLMQRQREAGLIDALAAPGSSLPGRIVQALAAIPVVDA